MSIKVSISRWEENYQSPLRESLSILENVEMVEKQDFSPVFFSDKQPETDFIFVDGIVRREATLFLEDRHYISPAYLYSIAAGAIYLKSHQINFFNNSLFSFCCQKYLLLENALEEEKEEIEAAFPFFPLSVVILKPNENPENRITNLLRELEGSLIEKICFSQKDYENTLIIQDGNLHLPSYRFPVFGYIKSFSKYYPDRESFTKNKNLIAKKQRSSIFKIESNTENKTYTRYSWYVALDVSHKIPWMHNLARIEIPALPDLNLEKIYEKANQTALFLPNFVISGHPRYPQNLAPIHALEIELRKRLGNPLIVKNQLLEKIGNLFFSNP